MFHRLAVVFAPAIGVAVWACGVLGTAPASAAELMKAAKRAAAAGSLAGVGDLPGGDVFSRANGVSADGQTVVGCSESARGSEAFRWTRRGGMVGLGDLDGGAFKSTATAASADGSVIVGCGAVAGTPDQRGFRWTASERLVPLPDHPSGAPYEACDVSADGSIVAGTLRVGLSGTNAFTWSQAGGYKLLESKVTMASKTFNALTDLYSLSGDGRIAVGYVKFTQIDFLQACIWVDGQGEPLRRSEFNEGLPYYLRDFVGTRTVCAAVAKDCVAVIGRCENKRRIGHRGFHIADGKFTWLESTGCSMTWPHAISGDGRTVVGRGSDRSGKDVACLWRAELGVQPLAEHLAGAGVTVGGWMLGEATGVSKDGRVIVGNGVNPQGQREAWIAQLPGTKGV